MTWPTPDVNTTNMDAGTDSPATARADLLDLATKFNLLRNHVSTFMQGVLARATAALVRADLGSTTVGDAVFVAGNAAAAQTALGAGTAGKNLFGAATAAAARTIVDATAPCVGATATTPNLYMTGSTWMKMPYTVVDYDPTSAYDNVTNYRFTPQAAGVYAVSAGFHVSTAAALAMTLYKNGSAHKIMGYTGTQYQIVGHAQVYLNGTTDYIEVYGSQGGADQLATTSPSASFLQIALIRAF